MNEKKREKEASMQLLRIQNSIDSKKIKVRTCIEFNEYALSFVLRIISSGLHAQ